VSVAVEDVTSATFLTLVAPLEDGKPAPSVRVCTAGEAVAVEVSGLARRDVVTWTPTQAAWLRTSEAGEPLSFRLCGAGKDWLAWDRGRPFRRGSDVP